MKDIFVILKYGFTDIYGIKWEDSQVDLYNKVSEEIHQREIGGHYKASEAMLDNRHRIYQLPLYNRNKREADDKKSRRRSVCVVIGNGNYIETDINGSKKEIRNYYLKAPFQYKDVIFTL